MTTPAAENDAPAPLPEGVEDDRGLRRIDPRRLQLHRGPSGALRASLGDRSYLLVSAWRAFPLSEPHRWLVLLDGARHPIGVVEDPLLLTGETQALLEEELDLRYLTPHVQAVRAIVEDTADGGSWSPATVWELETDRGLVHLRIPNLTDHLRPLGPGRYLLVDRDGRRAEFTAVAELDGHSRAILSRFIWIDAPAQVRGGA